MPNDTLTVPFRDLGLVTYETALKLQQLYHAQVVDHELPGMVLFLQHPSVITFGNRGDSQFLLKSREYLNFHGIALFDSDRGGEVTAHNEGQLVVYPILRQTPQFMPKKFVWALEEAVIRCLDQFQIRASRHPEFPGVWVKNHKICAVGIRIHKRVSMHGIALNINNDLTIFDHIVPCGIRSHGVTRVLDLFGPIDFEQVKHVLHATLAETLGLVWQKQRDLGEQEVFGHV